MPTARTLTTSRVFIVEVFPPPSRDGASRRSSARAVDEPQARDFTCLDDLLAYLGQAGAVPAPCTSGPEPEGLQPLARPRQRG